MIYYPQINYTNVFYNGLSVIPHPDQKLSLFLPLTSAPANGYPVIINFNLSGFINTFTHSQIGSSDSILYLALENGIAVISVSVTIARGGETGNPETYRAVRPQMASGGA